jgi:hypothetical protein
METGALAISQDCGLPWSPLSTEANQAATPHPMVSTIRLIVLYPKQHIEIES